MKTLINDLNAVIVNGVSTSTQKARVFIYIAIPAIVATLLLGHFPKY